LLQRKFLLEISLCRSDRIIATLDLPANNFAPFISPQATMRISDYFLALYFSKSKRIFSLSLSLSLSLSVCMCVCVCVCCVGKCQSFLFFNLISKFITIWKYFLHICNEYNLLAIDYKVGLIYFTVEIIADWIGSSGFLGPCAKGLCLNIKMVTYRSKFISSSS
jgi:hypothetical protein